MSGRAMLHGVGFFVAFGSLTAACLAFARRSLFRREPAWALYDLGTGIITPVIIGTGMANPLEACIPFAVAGIPAFGWVTVMAMRLLRERHPDRTSAQPTASETAMTHRDPIPGPNVE